MILPERESQGAVEIRGIWCVTSHTTGTGRGEITMSSEYKNSQKQEINTRSMAI